MWLFGVLEWTTVERVFGVLELRVNEKRYPLGAPEYIAHEFKVLQSHTRGPHPCLSFRWLNLVFKLQLCLTPCVVPWLCFPTSRIPCLTPIPCSCPTFCSLTLSAHTTHTSVSLSFLFSRSPLSLSLLCGLRSHSKSAVLAPAQCPQWL